MVGCQPCIWCIWQHLTCVYWNLTRNYKSQQTCRPVFRTGKCHHYIIHIMISSASYMSFLVCSPVGYWTGRFFHSFKHAGLTWAMLNHMGQNTVNRQHVLKINGPFVFKWGFQTKRKHQQGTAPGGAPQWCLLVYPCLSHDLVWHIYHKPEYNHS